MVITKEMVNYLPNVNVSCGTKAQCLAKLKENGVNVPDAFVIPSTVFCEYCKKEKIDFENFYTQHEYCDSIAHYINNCFEIILDENILGSGKYMVRSSAVPSDEIDRESFPSLISGVFDSYYAENSFQVSESIKLVWKSVFSEKSYNQNATFGYTAMINGMGVIIQRAIEAEISGVVHTDNNSISINWITGHLSALVSGKSRGENIDIYKSKENHYILRGTESSVKYIRDYYSELFTKLYNESIKIVELQESEQEIEWIFDGKELWFVQAQQWINFK